MMTSALQWNDTTRIVVREMSHKQHFACSAALNQWMQTLQPDKMDAFAYWKELVAVLIPFSRIEIYHNNIPLPAGTHVLGDETFVLPLTMECLDNLPATVAKFLIDATALENRMVLENFQHWIASWTATLSARVSASGVSPTPTLSSPTN
jgi:hypothetical protein